MFSCKKTLLLTLDQLEHPLSPTQRFSRRFHLLICRHCRAHSRQIHALLFALNPKNNIANLSLPRLSPHARNRIAAAVGDADRN